MYKTFYTNNLKVGYSYYIYLITKAESKREALIKFQNRLQSLGYILKVYLFQIHELGKLEIVYLTDY